VREKVSGAGGRAGSILPCARNGASPPSRTKPPAKILVNLQNIALRIIAMSARMQQAAERESKISNITLTTVEGIFHFTESS